MMSFILESQITEADVQGDDFDIYAAFSDDEVFYDQKGTDPLTPTIQYVAGTPDKASAGKDSPQYLGCWFIGDDRYSAPIPGFEKMTLFTKEGEQVEGQGCHVLPDAILLGSRSCWLADSQSALPVRFARSEYDEAIEYTNTLEGDVGTPRGKLQVRVLLPVDDEGNEEVFNLSLQGMNAGIMSRGGFDSPGIIQRFLQKVVSAFDAQRRRQARQNAGKDVQVSTKSTPACFFHLTGVAASQRLGKDGLKGEPKFVELGSKQGKKSKVTQPHWLGEPSGNADEAMHKALFVRDGAARARYQAMAKEADIWRDEWSLENLQAARVRLNIPAAGTAAAEGNDDENTPDEVNF